MPATAKFLHAVAGLPQGAVVLPGTRYRSRRRAPGSRSAASATRRVNSPRRRPPTIRNSRCMRCCSDSGSSAATSKSWATPAPQGRDVLVSEAMRPSNATGAMARAAGASRTSSAKISGGMKNLAVIDARQSRDGGAGDRGRDARGATSEQIGGAGDAGSRAGAAGDGGARPLESRIRRFRRRRADGHLGRQFSRGSPPKPRRSSWSRRPCWRC